LAAVYVVFSRPAFGGGRTSLIYRLEDSSPAVGTLLFGSCKDTAI